MLWMSAFDFDIHSSSEKALEEIDLGTKCRQILDDWTGIFTPPKGHGPNNDYLHWVILESYTTSAYCYLM